MSNRFPHPRSTPAPGTPRTERHRACPRGDGVPVSVLKGELRFADAARVLDPVWPLGAGVVGGGLRGRPRCGDSRRIPAVSPARSGAVSRRLLGTRSVMTPLCREKYVPPRARHTLPAQTSETMCTRTAGPRGATSTAGGGVRHLRTGRRHAGAPSGGCSSTRGLYSTSWMRPSKVRCSIISRATSG